MHPLTISSDIPIDNVLLSCRRKLTISSDIMLPSLSLLKEIKCTTEIVSEKEDLKQKDDLSHYFIIVLAVRLLMILRKMINLTHNSFLCIYFNSLHVSSNLVLISRRINCINTTSGICHPVSVNVSCAGRRQRHRVTYTRGCIDTIDSPDDEHRVARNM